MQHIEANMKIRQFWTTFAMPYENAYNSVDILGHRP